MPHHCHAKGCNRAVPPRMLMCLAHWRLVPPDLQRAVWREYEEGQELTKTPSEAYLTVQRQAIEAVALAEERGE